VELSALAANLEAVAGIESLAVRPESHQLGCGAFDIWEIVNAWLPHVGDQVLGAATAVLIQWVTSRYRRYRPVRVRIFGPDGRVLRVVQRRRKTGPPELLSEDPDAPRHLETNTRLGGDPPTGRHGWDVRKRLRTLTRPEPLDGDQRRPARA
jgi:hypothetical protein